jgi:hypothetical protein
MIFKFKIAHDLSTVLPFPWNTAQKTEEEGNMSLGKVTLLQILQWNQYWYILEENCVSECD